MDWALYLKAVVLGVVEGLTEFLPISSTGHLIIAGQLLGYTGDKAKVFEIVIQSGAMLAVIWEYRARFGHMLRGLHRDAAARRFAVNLAVAFLPAALLGLAFAGAIKHHLFHAVPVA
ncbi:MAG: undecaprenyl-diphosphate phosphatase, partial [Burkholderiales bacterium]